MNFALAHAAVFAFKNATFKVGHLGFLLGCPF